MEGSENNNLKEIFSAENNHEEPVQVDANCLQYQNQKLLQQIEKQKQEFLGLEAKVKELENMQGSYDDILISVNQLWNQLVDDLVLLGVCAGVDDKLALEAWSIVISERGQIPMCPPEDTFLCRLLHKDSIESNGNEGITKYIEGALAARHASTRELMKSVEDCVSAQKAKTVSIARALAGNISSEGALVELSKLDDMLREEAKNLRAVIDFLHSKHKEYADQLIAYIGAYSTDKSEIHRVAGELDDAMAELEECRRKILNLKTQKDMATGVQFPSSGAANGNLSPEKSAERSISLRDLKNSIEETKMLLTNRASNHKEAQEENLVLSKQLEDVKNELKDDKFVRSSKVHISLNDQLQFWNSERDRYKALVDGLQAERPQVIRRDKELTAKLESVEAARKVIENSDPRIEELAFQLEKCIMERNELEIKMEEAIQDSERKDIKEEFRVMALSLSKELEMVSSQVKRWKDTAHETNSLREKAKSLKTLIDEKTDENKRLEDFCEEQDNEIKALKAKIEESKKRNLEIQFMVDMYAQSINDDRTLEEIRESERRASHQAELLRNALAEHSLELRVKAAKETEEACQRRLKTAEAEIAELRVELNSSERDVFEMTEAIKMKELEAEAYISEIETIGQAYEDMQAQNQRLMEQVTARDDYNIKLVSESVKAKQAQSVLLAEKQSMTEQLQRTSSLLGSLKAKITHDEDQMMAYLAQTSKLTAEERQRLIEFENAKVELANAEKELKWLKSVAASTENEYEEIQQDVEDAKIELENERNSRKVLEEELEELKTVVEEMSSRNGEAAVQKLQEEIKVCKSVLQCLVCRDRPKEVVIVKCYHLFCNQCIQKNLETRHRKCPACGTPFGQNDIRFVKI